MRGEMEIKGTTKLLGVLGYPVAHSFSPQMHNAVLRKMELDMVYVPLEVDPKDLADVINGMRGMNFIGANVTIPHKQDAAKLMDEVSPESKIMGVVNTIVNREGKLWGTTTDPKGFLASLAFEGVSMENKNILILGTGGTARTIAFALFIEGKARDISMAGRRPQKAREIAAEIKDSFNKELRVLDLNDRDAMTAQIKSTQLIVNATSVGMHPDVEESPLDPALLHEDLVVYDTVYNPRITRLMSQAEEKGCKTVSGLGMLVCQGWESFKIWTGTKPPVDYFWEFFK
jgi:shikimate dehydrogenase